MSDNIRELTQAVERSNESFEDFKNRTLAQMNDRMDAIEAKMQRPALGAAVGAMDPKATADLPEVKAFRAYLCSGEGKSLSTGSGADGGYAVPKVIDQAIEALVVNISPIRSIAKVVQISTQDFHYLVNRRGTASGWAAESDPRTSTATAQLTDVQPPMGDLWAMPVASQWVVDDAMFNLETWLADQVATEFGRQEGATFVSGNGVNRPLGFLSGPTPVTTDDTTRAYGTLQYTPSGAAGAFRTTTSTDNPVDDLIKMMFSLKAGYRRNACWVMSKATLGLVMQLKDTYGRYVFNPSTAPNVPATICGYPVVEAEDMPAVAANSFSVAFGDFGAGYLIVDRLGTRVLRDPFTVRPNLAYYSLKRVGGCVLNSEALKLMRMATT